MGSGGSITSMFLCKHRHSNLIIFPAVMQTRVPHFHHGSRWGGVRAITSMLLRVTHRHSNLIIFLAVVQTLFLLHVKTVVSPSIRCA